MVDFLLRRQLENTLQRWQPAIPKPFSVEAFCANLAELRGRPIVLIPWDTRQINQPTGLWIGTAKADYIVFDALTTAIHRAHIVLHELGHLLLGHHDGNAGSVDLLVGGIDPTTVLAAVGRTRAYDERDECEAEQFATYVGERAARQRPDIVGELARVAEHALVIDRLSAAFAGDRPWRR